MQRFKEWYDSKRIEEKRLLSLLLVFAYALLLLYCLGITSFLLRPFIFAENPLAPPTIAPLPLVLTPGATLPPQPTVTLPAT
ncbi:MAG: hypothetical protein HYX86_01165, partial [Chloroflexi bacterium]|nr:hypothetical protein [Chloroflexota bacterium]